MIHTISIDHEIDGADSAYKAFCDCGWCADSWRHEDQFPAGEGYRAETQAVIDGEDHALEHRLDYRPDNAPLRQFAAIANGRFLRTGDRVTDFRGETGTFMAVTRAPLPGKSAQVRVSTGHDNWHYSSVWGITVVEATGPWAARIYEPITGPAPTLRLNVKDGFVEFNFGGSNV